MLNGLTVFSTIVFGHVATPTSATIEVSSQVTHSYIGRRCVLFIACWLRKRRVDYRIPMDRVRRWRLINGGVVGGVQYSASSATCTRRTSRSA